MVINFFIALASVLWTCSVFGMEQVVQQQQYKDECESLGKSFKGAEPFYGIAITRESNDYVPLSEEESYFVFCILSHIFGTTITEKKFSQDIEAIFSHKKERMELLKNMRNQIQKTELEKEEKNKKIEKNILKKMMESLNRKPLFKNNNIDLDKINDLSTKVLPTLVNNEKEAIQQIIQFILPVKFTDDKEKAVKLIIAELKEFEKIKMQQIELIVQNSFTESENYFVTNLKNKSLNNKSLDNFYIEQKDIFIQHYQNFIKQFKEFPKELSKIPKSWSLVVFNEMFFSKKMPLGQEDMLDIMCTLEQFSKLNNKALINVNFLMEHKEGFNSIEERNKRLQEEGKLYQKLKQQHSTDNFFHSAHSRIEWTNMFLNIEKSEQTEINVIHNDSFTFWNSEVLNFYRKASYRDEAEASLKKNGYIYAIGSNIDHPLEADKPSLIQTLLLDNVSTEICYDLEIGSRKNYNIYPKNHKIHILQSNTLPITNNNIDNLPENGSIIFHVDPDYTEVLVQNNFRLALTKADEGLLNKYKISKFERKNPFFSMKILLNDNIFTFSCWSLNCTPLSRPFFY